MQRLYIKINDSKKKNRMWNNFLRIKPKYQLVVRLKVHKYY